MTSELAPLYTALLNAQYQIGEPTKDGRNKFSNYDYTTAENMIRCCKIALNNSGLVLIAGATTFREEGDAEEVRVYIHRAFILAHPGSGGSLPLEHEYAVCRTPSTKGGFSMDWDKSGAASQTSGLSYFLRDLLMAPRADDEVDSGSGQAREAQNKNRQTPPPQTPPPPANDPELLAETHEYVDKLEALVKLYQAEDNQAAVDTISGVLVNASVRHLPAMKACYDAATKKRQERKEDVNHE